MQNQNKNIHSTMLMKTTQNLYTKDRHFIVTAIFRVNLVWSYERKTIKGGSITSCQKKKKMQFEIVDGINSWPDLQDCFKRTYCPIHALMLKTCHLFLYQ